MFLPWYTQLEYLLRIILALICGGADRLRARTSCEVRRNSHAYDRCCQLCLNDRAFQVWILGCFVRSNAGDWREGGLFPCSGGDCVSHWFSRCRCNFHQRSKGERRDYRRRALVYSRYGDDLWGRIVFYRWCIYLCDFADAAVDEKTAGEEASVCAGDLARDGNAGDTL